MRATVRASILAMMLAALIGSAASGVVAQEDGAADQSGEATPATAVGTLRVIVLTCLSGGEPGTTAVVPESSFAPGPDCSPASAAIALDGADAGQVDGQLEWSVEAGTHTVGELASGSAADVEVAADAVTTVYVVTFEAEEVEPEPTPTESAPTPTEVGIAAVVPLRFTLHVCPPAIQTPDQFAALSDEVDRLLACPVTTRPEHTGSDGAIRAEPVDFNLTLTDANGATLTLADATFAPAQLCESDLGEDTDGRPETNRCYDVSSYELSSNGSTNAAVSLPEELRLGAITGEPTDAVTFTAFDSAAGTFAIEPADDSGQPITVHIYAFSPPRVSVALHRCPDSITEADFAALSDFYAQWWTCKVSVLHEHDGPDGALNAGHAAFEASLTVNGETRDLDDANFLPEQVCELDLGRDLNGDPNDDVCLDASRYAFDDVAQGGVVVTLDSPPKNHTLIAALVSPDSDDAATVQDVDLTAHTVSLDTTNDSDVTIHFFVLETPPTDPTATATASATATPTMTPTATATGTPGSGGGSGGNGGQVTPTPGNGDGSGGGSGGGSGSLLIYSLFCLADSESVRFEVLQPGEQIPPLNFGDETCVTGDNEFQIVLHGNQPQSPFLVGIDGEALLSDLPAADESTGAHLLVETFSGESAPFFIAPNTTTEIVVLVYELDYTMEESVDVDGDGVPDTTYEDPGVEAEVEVESAEGLPDTGSGSVAATPMSASLLLFTGAGLLALRGLSRRRIRSATRAS